MLLLTAFLLGATQGTDTTISVRAATRLELSSFEGDITVQSWNRNAVRIEADHDEETRIAVDQGSRTLSVRARWRHGPAEVTWRLTVPAEMALDLASQSGNIRVTGVKGEISVETVEGDIAVQGGSGYVSLQSADGSIELSGSSGRIRINAIDGDIAVRGANGSLRVNAVDGEILAQDIESGDVELNTVDGDILFAGAIRAGGRYRATSHDGDVTVIVPAINADVSVSTFSGDFESDFPVTLSGPQPRKRMSFTLGSGGARLELESFDGRISLRKASGRKP
jgi:DUF4097 and DUF4098 domain-containing protein YvlB